MGNLTCEESFFGSVTVGERGQVVIPAEVRKEMSIEPGDRLLVFRHPMGNGIILGKIAGVQDLVKMFQSAIESAKEPDGAATAEE